MGHGMVVVRGSAPVRSSTSGNSSSNGSSAHMWAYRAAWAGAAAAEERLKYTFASAACLLILLPCHKRMITLRVDQFFLLFG